MIGGREGCATHEPRWLRALWWQESLAVIRRSGNCAPSKRWDMRNAKATIIETLHEQTQILPDVLEKERFTRNDVWRANLHVRIHIETA